MASLEPSLSRSAPSTLLPVSDPATQRASKAQEGKERNSGQLIFQWRACFPVATLVSSSRPRRVNNKQSKQHQQTKQHEGDRLSRVSTTDVRPPMGLDLGVSLSPGPEGSGAALRPGPRPRPAPCQLSFCSPTNISSPAAPRRGARRRPCMRVPSAPNLSGARGADYEDPEEPLGPTADLLAMAILLPEGFLLTCYYWILCCISG